MRETIEDDQTEAVAALLLASVNAPEREIYQTARSIVVMLSRDAEIERLRASMKRIRSLTAAETCDESEALDQIFTIARAALGEEGNG